MGAECARGQLLDLHAATRADQPETVGEELSVQVKQAGPQTRLIDESPDDRARGFGREPLLAGRTDRHRRSAEGAGEEVALRPERVELGGNQLGAIFAEIEQAADRNQQGQDIQRQDPTGKSEPGAPPLAGARCCRGGRLIGRLFASAFFKQARFNSPVAIAIAVAPVANGRGSDSLLRTRSRSRRIPDRPRRIPC